jgi:hypothetical protein
MRAHHEGVVTVNGRRAGVLAAEVNEVGTVSVAPEEVVYPVALLVGRRALEIEVVNVVVEPFLLEERKVYVR